MQREQRQVSSADVFKMRFGLRAIIEVYKVKIKSAAEAKHVSPNDDGWINHSGSFHISVKQEPERECTS